MKNTFHLGPFSFLGGPPVGHFAKSVDTKRYFHFFGLSYHYVIFVLDRKFSMKFTYRGQDYLLEAEAGAKTDGATIPKIFWSIFGGPFSGLYVWAVMVHDFLYSLSDSGVVTRKMADDTAMVIMESMGVDKRRYLMYGVIRLLGYLHWDKPSANSDLVTIAKI